MGGLNDLNIDTTSRLLEFMARKLMLTLWAQTNGLEMFCQMKLKATTLKTFFNADETGLVYKALQSATLTFHGTQPVGGKLPKQRLTALLCVNMDGSEKNVYVVGKYKKPRCFSRVQNLPLPYYNNQNSWMTSVIWKDILLKMNRIFEAQGRHIVLFVDNATCHKCDDPTPFVKVIFLPPNTTSLIQPCDQGIIRAVKAHYRRQVNRKMLIGVENGMTTQEFSKTITVLDAMFMLKRALFLIKPETIQNCFRKGRFILTDDETEATDLDAAIDNEDGEDDENEEFHRFVEFDNDIPTHGELTDKEICEHVSNNIGNIDDDDSDESENDLEEEKLTWAEGVDAMRKFQRFLQENYEGFDSLAFGTVGRNGGARRY